MSVRSGKKSKRDILFYKDRLFTASVVIFLLLFLTFGAFVWLVNSLHV